MPAAPQPLDLVREVMEHLGIRPTGRQTGASELARRLGWETAKAQQNFRRWGKDGSLPDYYETWAMLDALGWIQPEQRPVDLAEDVVRQLEAGEKFPRRDLERLADSVERVAESLPHLVEQLREGARAARRAR